MTDEGYIKFSCDWTKGPPFENAAIAELNKWRRPLFDAGLVGQYEDTGVGFGNMSMRSGPDVQFVISGTQTGHLADLTGAHYAEVTNYDIEGNRITCHGPVKASSESLTHAAIYELGPDDSGHRACPQRHPVARASQYDTDNRSHCDIWHTRYGGGVPEAVL